MSTFRKTGNFTVTGRKKTVTSFS